MVLQAFSLLLAIVLVAFVDNTQVNTNNQTKVQEMASTEQSLKMALQVSVDTDKYYVTGYPSKVKVTLEGPNALVTSAVNTQNFRVYIDLSKLGVGSHQVPIKVSGLPSQVSYKLPQKSVKVNIQKRKSRTLPVQIGYNKNAVAQGYDIGTPTVSPETVEVTGAQSEVKAIDHVPGPASRAKRQHRDSAAERSSSRIRCQGPPAQRGDQSGNGPGNPAFVGL